MHGQMMTLPLIVSSLLEHAERYHGDTEIVSRTVEGTLHRYTYADAHRRAKKAANALKKLGVQQGDRVGTLAWNGYRHFELYYAISGMGAITHTINPRLFPEQISWIANDAEDGVVFFDLSFASLVESIAAHCPSVKYWVAMTAPAHMPALSIPNLLCYEDLLAEESDDFAWPQLDENDAAALCYTSGTTGNPKGVLYSHRSTLLHALSSSLPDALALSGRDVISPVVPMFHVNAWGLPYSAPLVGAKLVFPGAALDGESVFELFENEGVTFSAGVPTVWLAVLQYMQKSGSALSSVKRMVVGGAACPPALMKAYEKDFGIKIQHAWGMTEMSPMGTVSTLKESHLKLSEEARFAIEVKQGRPPFGIDLKIVDDDGNALPRDGKTSGALLVRGHWVLNQYFRKDDSPLLDGWFPTGDVATLDQDGFMQITDRSKDVIKSGGEWISSIELENIAMGHPAVAEAAALGMAHPKWDERPLLVVVKKVDQGVSREDILAQYPGKVAKFCIPDDVVFVDEIPHTATGKISKVQLREQLREYRWPTANPAQA
ncbi:3-(methylthio)propionyl-CoA ligase [Pseudomonas resinovorans]|uniref:3-(Methylthio)propionyl-CoA ligase n=1 Tax=Metapseudomonas resinovorans TaxID=53412 RepID=A0ABT4Y6Z0_METRE|nr:3-(methylthio)propionyl-CoA ligase [Pseudomonas resinovorans]MDA8484635.1 3-(methylthio)propionyl-CoA ligase [Pseudomonas resinovorans]